MLRRAARDGKARPKLSVRPTSAGWQVLAAGAVVFFVARLIGTTQFHQLAYALLALPVASLAAWRAGIVLGWAVVAAAGGVATFLISGVTVPGMAITAALFSAFAYALWRSDRI